MTYLGQILLPTFALRSMRTTITCFKSYNFKATELEPEARTPRLSRHHPQLIAEGEAELARENDQLYVDNRSGLFSGYQGW